MKKALLFILFFLTATVAVGLITLTDESMQPFSVIKLNGEESVKIEVFEQYNDPGCIAEEGNKILGFRSIEYSVKSDFDNNKVGEYIIQYTTCGKTEPVIVQRVVNVVDTQSPIITAPTEITEYTGTTEFNFDYTAVDNYDGDISAQVDSRFDGEKVWLTVFDSSGNKGEASVKINFIDDVTPPNLKLSGFPYCHLLKGETYVEPGYSAVDNRDGDITDKVVVSSTLDTSVAGDYELTYTVTDEFGNTKTAKRFVSVHETTPADDINNSVICLTFDDGPGKYTSKLLNILAEYNVKSTFFVTNQFPAYQNLIGRAYREGHAIGIHTYSHQWSIYSGKDAYYADFLLMNNIIKEQTGKYSNIFRFPGGSSNTVSEKYSIGIVSSLNEELKQAGFVEYDWNIDCADTVYKSSRAIFNQVKKSLRKNRVNIVLMHDIKSYTVNAVPMIIEYALENGYRFDVLNENIEPYQLEIKN